MWCRLEQAEKALKIASDKKAEAEFQQMNSEWKGLLEDNEDDAIAVKKFLEDKIAVEVAASTAARHALQRAKVVHTATKLCTNSTQSV